MKHVKRAFAVALATMMLVILGAAPALATVYWNCQEGVACVWTNSGGGGSKLTLSVGAYGYNQCWNFSSSWNDVISSASASFGGGWDLVLFKDAHCSGGLLGTIYLDSPESQSFTGLLAWKNDIASSFTIAQA